ncbi:hypothetical protein K461DRAFT_271501 [Myriangium duriaei CBS 260.36]|uniref:Uncharacterized protein n=1 Tax=Myriangium duriaei CBS 260.36 TaxID=1168546 RepID=A0A9P4IY01_9PEZI|nr:hypothetical protein K461DRAFT_271501 [Myriangium duriaei CBS 260.36]
MYKSQLLLLLLLVLGIAADSVRLIIYYGNEGQSVTRGKDMSSYATRRVKGSISQWSNGRFKAALYPSVLRVYNVTPLGSSEGGEAMLNELEQLLRDRTGE